MDGEVQRKRHTLCSSTGTWLHHFKCIALAISLKAVILKAVYFSLYMLICISLVCS